MFGPGRWPRPGWRIVGTPYPFDAPKQQPAIGPPPPGAQVYDRPPIDTRHAGARAGLRTWIDSLVLTVLKGQDQFPPGESVFDLPVRRQADPFDVSLRTWAHRGIALLYTIQPTPFDWQPPTGPPPPLSLRAWSQSLVLTTLRGQDQLPPGDVSADLAPRAPPAQHAQRTWTWSYALELIGQDRFPPGDISAELPPRAPAPQHGQRTWTWSYNLNLVGKDVVPPGLPGEQAFDPPPRGGPRLDLSWSQNLLQTTLAPAAAQAPFAQRDWPLPQGTQPAADLRTWLNGFNLNLLPVQAVFRAELASLPPPSPPLTPPFWGLNLLTSTLAAPPPPLPPGARVVEAPARPGQARTWELNLLQTTLAPVSIALPFNQADWPTPRAAPYPIDLRTWIPQSTVQFRYTYQPTPFVWDIPARVPFQPDPAWNNLLPLQTAPPPVKPPGAALFDLARGAAPPVQTWTWSYSLELIGQDKLPAGRSVVEAPPRPAWLRDWSQNLLQMTLAPPLAAFPFNQASWPLPGRFPASAWPATAWAWFYNPNLIGKDALPIRQQDWPLPREPERPQRAFEFYAFIPTVAFPPRPVVQTDWPLTPAAVGAVDLRTWARGYNLNLIGKDVLPPGRSTLPSELPPRGAPREWPRFWTASFPLELVGKDKLPFGTTSLELPPRGPLLPQRSFSFSQSIPLVATLFPFAQHDWPLPRGPAQNADLRTWASGFQMLLQPMAVQSRTTVAQWGSRTVTVSYGSKTTVV